VERTSVVLLVCRAPRTTTTGITRSGQGSRHRGVCARASSCATSWFTLVMPKSGSRRGAVNSHASCVNLTRAEVSFPRKSVAEPGGYQSVQVLLSESGHRWRARRLPGPRLDHRTKHALLNW
jgi:hypothetical protein